MSSFKLSFRNIQIRKMPGFTRYGRSFETGDLSPCINVVYGPNGSGKTTIAKAISAVLWPDANEDYNAEVQGTIRLDNDEMLFDVAGTRRTCRMNGNERDLPPLPPAELRDSYSLALHVLMTDKNTPFAEEIRKESIGGFNIAGAKADLGLADKVSLPRTLKENLDAAVQSLAEARDEQEARKSDEDELQANRARLEAANEARGEVQRLELAINYKRASSAADQADTMFRQYPEALAHVSDGALDRAREAEKEIADCEQKTANAEAAIKQTETRIAALKLPDDGVPDSTVGELNERMERLRQIDATLQQEKKDVEEAAQERADALKRIGGRISSGGLEELDPVKLDRLQQFVERSQSVKAERKGRSAVHEWLGDPGSDQDPDTLQQGIRLLQKWQITRETGARGGPVGRMRAIGVASSLALGALFVYLGLTQSFAWFAGVLLPVGITIATLLPSGSKGSARAGQCEDDYRALDLPQPDMWEDGIVRSVLEGLCEALRTADLDREKAEVLRDYDGREKELAQREAELAEQRAGLTKDLGLAADTGELVLHVLAEAIARWQGANQRVVGAEEKVKETEGLRESALAEMNETLKRYGYAETRASAEVYGSIVDVAKRRQDFVTASQTLEAERKNVEQLAARADAARRRLKNEFESLGLAEGDFGQLTDYCRQRPLYDEADSARNDAQAALRVAEKAVQDAGLEVDEVRGMDLAVVEQELAEARSRAEKRDELSDMVLKAEADIERAKHGHSVEDALAAVESAEQAIAEQREKNCASVVGAAVADFLEERVRDVNRPNVFRRAGELLREITNGRYELRFDETGDKPEFAALDTVENELKALDELSSGTRLQLLLSVRIAFVEKFETDGVKLPLVFDEVLANSDDTRAMAILDAVKTLAKNGRQVFYFTAQNDEVAKWRSVLSSWSGGDAPKFVDLVQQRSLTEGAGMTHEQAEWAPPARVAEPGLSSYDQYRGTINVPPYNPYAELTSQHVWYFFDDTRDVHALLRIGIDTWGQFLSMSEVNPGLLPGGAQSRAAADRRARIIAMYADTWRIGRGLPISATVIDETEAIQEKYMDSVRALIEEVHGNAKAFMANCSRVKGPRTATWEKVRAYLEEHGYLDESDALTASQVRTRVLVSLTPEIPEQEIDATLSRLA